MVVGIGVVEEGIEGGLVGVVGVGVGVVKADVEEGDGEEEEDGGG